MKAIYLLLASTIMFSGCSKPKVIKNRDNFPNYIDYRFTPKALKSKAICMADLGAWHGISLPSNSDTINGPTGPYLLGNSIWVGKTLSALTLFNLNTKSEVKFTNWESTSYPGLFKIISSNKDVELIIDIFYISSCSYAVDAKVTNTSNTQQALRLDWYGEVFKPLKLTQIQNGQKVIINADTLIISFKPAPIINKNPTKTSYKATVANKLLLNPGETQSFIAMVSYIQNTGNFKQLNEDTKRLENIDSLLEANTNRWNGYINKTIRPDIEKYSYIPVKAVQTLITNWKSPNGSLKHNGLVPSMAVSYFYGFWAWDSWKHAVALAGIEPELAKDQIRAMFDYQDSCGMIADCIYPDSTENNWRNTKPPLAAWAVWKVFETTNDTSFIVEILPKLEKYHEWWYKYRDFNSNGLCEYGSTDGTLIAAKWESGMDNAIRFDSSSIIKNGSGQFSLNQESVDLNAYLFLEKVYLSKLNNVVNNPQATKYLRESRALAQKITETFYVDSLGYFFDWIPAKKEHITVFGPEGWIPLWCSAATEKQAKAIAKVLLNEKKFNTKVPFPTVDVSHPKFIANGYWRGAVWLDQAYFAIAGLRNYGLNQQADSLTIKIFENTKGLKTNAPIYENYNPLNGKPQEAPNFSWSAAHLLMLYNELYK